MVSFFPAGGVFIIVPMSFSCNFHVELKEFQVLINSKGVIKLAEGSVKSMSVIQMGRFRAVWMVNITDKLMEVTADIEFAV